MNPTKNSTKTDLISKHLKVEQARQATGPSEALQYSGRNSDQSLWVQRSRWNSLVNHECFAPKKKKSYKLQKRKSMVKSNHVGTHGKCLCYVLRCGFHLGVLIKPLTGFQLYNSSWKSCQTCRMRRKASRLICVLCVFFWHQVSAWSLSSSSCHPVAQGLPSTELR